MYRTNQIKMIDIKVSLIVAVPGTVPFSKQQCFKNCKVTDKSGRTHDVEVPIESMTEPFIAFIPEKDPRSGKFVSMRRTLHIRRRQPAHQVINMCSQAYDCMIDAGACPEWFRVPGKNPVKEWKALNITQRLELHLKRVASDLGGVMASYSVADD